MTQQESPQQAAQRQLEAEEGQRRQSRLDALTQQEKSRRDQQAREEQAEARRAEAAERAEKLGARRAEIEAKIEEQTAALNGTLGDLQKLDSEHRTAMREAGTLGNHSMHSAPLTRPVGEFLESAFEGFLKAKPRARNQRSLREMDFLTPTSEATDQRAPAPGIPGADPRDGERLEASRFLNTLQQRATMLRRQYSRDLSYGELVSPDEKEQVEALSEEDRQRVQAMLRGEGGR